MSFKGKQYDQRLHGICSFLARGCGPLCSVFDKITRLEAACKNKSVVMKDGCLVAGLVAIDVSELRRMLGISLQLLGAGHGILLQRRKSGLKIHLDSKYHQFTRDSNEITDDLLGPNLESRIADCSSISDAVNKIKRFKQATSRGHRQYPPSGRYRNRTFNRNRVGFRRSYDRQAVNSNSSASYTCGRRFTGRNMRGNFQRRPRFNNFRGRSNNQRWRK